MTTPILQPVTLYQPWANGGNKNAIPNAASPTLGVASLEEGFPPETMQPIQTGGVPPSGLDMNGGLNLATQHSAWVAAGGMYKFNSALVAFTGGYNLGAVIQGNDNRTAFISLANTNTVDPNATPSSVGVQWALYAGDIKAYAGNPNGNVAGYAATSAISQPSFAWDTVNRVLWVCITTGTTGTAVWVTASGSGLLFGGTSTGSANAQVITPAVPLGAYAAGRTVSFIAGYSNSGALSVNVSGLGSRGAFKQGTTGVIACIGGEVKAGNLVTLIDDGVAFQIVAITQGTACMQDATSITGKVVAMLGTATVGHILRASDTAGTAQDGGLPGVAPSRTHISAAPGTLGPGAYNIDTTAAAFAASTMTVPAVGDNLLFADLKGTYGTNNFTINFAGGFDFTCNGFTGNQLVCNTSGLEFQIWFDGTNWRAT